LTDPLYETKTFDAFWARYLELHAEPFVARMHAVATASAGALIAAALVTGHAWIAVLAPAVDYAIAQSSHRVRGVKTRPCVRPHWHLRAELRLFARTLSQLGSAGRASTARPRARA
jgi:hypothetical protein